MPTQKLHWQPRRACACWSGYFKMAFTGWSFKVPFILLSEIYLCFQGHLFGYKLVCRKNFIKLRDTSSVVLWKATGTFCTVKAALWSRSDRSTQRIRKNFSINSSKDEYRVMTDFNFWLIYSKRLLVPFRKFPVLYDIPITHCLWMGCQFALT